MNKLLISFVYILILFSTLNAAMTIDIDETGNLNCPGDTITEINNLITSFNESATGAMQSGWDVDRMHFQVDEAGLIKINLTASQALTIKAGNTCGTETYFRSQDKAAHTQEFRVAAGEVINISIFDWESGGGYDYTLGIEFISDSGGVVLPEPEVDTTPPVMTLIGDNPINLQVGDIFTDPGALAFDDFDEDVTSAISVMGSVNTAVAGTYFLTYTVSDQAGNEAAMTRDIVVFGEIAAPPPENTEFTEAENVNNGNCPGEIIPQLDGINYSITILGTGIMNAGWDVDRYSFTPAVSGTVNVSLNAPEPMTFKAGNICNTQNFFRSSANTVHAHSFHVEANELVSLSMFDWDTNNYVYTLGIEFISDSGGDIPPPEEPEVDTTPPVMTLIGDNPMNLTVGDTFIDPGANAIDGDTNLTASIVPTSTVNTAVSGDYTVTYFVSDAAGNSTFLTRSVVVEAKSVIPPPPSSNGMTIDIDETGNLNCPGDTIIEINNVTTSFNESATGAMQSGWDVDRMHFQVDEAGFIKINLTASQALTIKAGNTCGTETYFRSQDKAAHTQEFRVAAGDVINISMFDWESGGGYDYTLGIEFISDSGGVVPPPEPEVDAIAPIITLLGANLINLQVGDTFIDSGARAIDNIDGNLTALIVAASDVNTTVAGSYAVIYSVFDAAGNSAQKIRTVIVRSESLIGRNLYVSVNGNDDWSGLVQSPIEDDGPFKTIQHAANVAMPGDTVYIREGTYDEIVIFTRSGSQQDGHITFTNFPAENPVITRTDSDTDNDTFYGEDVSFIRIEGLKFEKCVRNVISFRHSHYIEIKNNEISETNFNIPDNRGMRMGRAIWIVGTKDTNSSHILIEGNHIHHNHTGDSNGGYDEALTIVGNVNYFKVINNIVHDNDFIGIDIIGHQEGQWSVFGMNKYGYVANNISYNNGLQREWASGLYVDGADHLIVENNIIYDNNGPGIVVSQETKESTTDNVIVRFNTSWNNHYSSIGSHPSTGGSVNDTVYVHNTSNGSKNNEPEIIFGLGENNRIKNNIFIATSRAFSGGISGMDTSSWEIDYNCYIPMVSNLLTISDGHNSYEDFEQYQILTEKDLHSLNIENGYFADIINHDYRLTDQSPCIDQGGFLTTTILGGNGTEVPVKDARYFTSGWGLTNPDMIQIGNNHPVQVLDVNYETNTIIVSQTLTWLENDGVSYFYNGAKPDMGAFEY